MPASATPPLSLPPELDRVRALRPPDLPVWLVGGSVRDALLGRRPAGDLDFVVAGDALTLARTVADRLGGAFYALDAERGTGRVILPGRRPPPGGDPARTLDFARLRGPDLPADLRARDFTLNAMAVSLADPETLIDPLGGQADLRAGLLRVCAPTALSDDPLRALRAIRLASQFGLRLERGARELVRAASPALGQVSPERVRDEFLRIVGGRKPAGAVRALDRLGLLAPILPELSLLKGVTQSPPHTLDVWEHTLAVLARLSDLYSVLGPVHDVDAASDLILGLAAVKLGRFRAEISAHLDAPLAGERPTRWLLNLAALLHDICKPQARSVDPDGRVRFLDHEGQGAELAQAIAGRLRLSVEEARRLRAVVAGHMRPALLRREAQLSRRAIYRFFRDAGTAGVDICLLSLADALGTYGVTLPQDRWLTQLELTSRLLAAWFHAPDRLVSPAPLLTGHDLMAAFDLQSGPRIGELLEALREAQAAGDVNDRAAALRFVQRRLAQNP